MKQELLWLLGLCIIWVVIMTVVAGYAFFNRGEPIAGLVLIIASSIFIQTIFSKSKKYFKV